MRKSTVLKSLVIVLVGTCIAGCSPEKVPEVKEPIIEKAEPAPAQVQKKEKTQAILDFDKENYENTNITKNPEEEGDIPLLVNKHNGLEKGYVPSDLIDVPSSGENGVVQMRKEAGEAFKKLSEWAKTEGFTLNACSAYRSADYHDKLWKNGEKSGGTEYADRWWTRSGYSEHQTGLAVDIRINNDRSDLDAVRKYPQEYQKLLDNIVNYGFILRYPEGKEGITGIAPESWHLRYVGKETAEEIAKKGAVLEQYIADKKLEKLYKDLER